MNTTSSTRTVMYWSRPVRGRGVPLSFTVNHGATRSVYFLDPDGDQLEVYLDNPPEEIAKMSDSYFGLDKPEFAPDAPSLRDYFAPIMARVAKTH